MKKNDKAKIVINIDKVNGCPVDFKIDQDASVVDIQLAISGLLDLMNQSLQGQKKQFSDFMLETMIMAHGNATN